jgi:prepilin-type N-terminal cleavage/methylation domain-containing protein
MKATILKNHKGFTLIEILVVLGVILSIFAVTFPFVINRPSEAQLEKYALELEFSIFSTQQNAYSAKNNKSYGIAFYTNKYSVFTGTSKASAQSSTDINYSGVRMQGIVLIDGSSEIVFSSGSFKPNTSGFLTLTNGTKTIRIDITSEGRISRA